MSDHILESCMGSDQKDKIDIVLDKTVQLRGLIVAKLSPSSSSSWDELASFSVDQVSHPPTHGKC